MGHTTRKRNITRIGRDSVPRNVSPRKETETPHSIFTFPPKNLTTGDRIIYHGIHGKTKGKFLQMDLDAEESDVLDVEDSKGNVEVIPSDNVIKVLD